MSSADKLYELAKSLPEEQAAEILDFAEFLLQKRSRQLSTEVATSTEPQLLDFRQAAGLGQEVWQSVNVEQYLQQERAAWD
ncbi:DUF2281 domain-containing protein [Oscillatoria sp. FACHB-1406]|uniref:DUF2281 domain-containing protein n=1 Tax=Oscillatoria sp. FACHB-1406 TaxID=2692846 RepID=UPI00168974C2|nr:DUF2281 domain-containing protein [Oscillatoria sp. FACHB-1406]MBD2576820.1 DUF2281 domain-containing protein [Oscillatoria sp. FACHB-1406]